MKIIIPFGENPNNKKAVEMQAIDVLLEIKDKTGYDGWVEDEEGNKIRGTI